MKKISALMAACSVGLAVQAQIIDTLTGGSLASYTKTIVLSQNADGPMTFTSTGSGLQVSRVISSGSSAQQDLLLRGDYSLSVGNTLRVSITGLGTSGGVNADFGLAIASQVDPYSLPWTSGTVNTRSNTLAMYVKPGSSQVGSFGFNGTTQLSYTGSGSITPGAGVYATITGLWISETAANVFNIGYTTASGDITLSSGITFTGVAVDQTVGFFADLRGTLTSPAIFTDLRLEPIPEPSTLALCGMSFLGLVAMLRRKK